MSTIQVHRFNTGRLYQRDGQWIYWGRLEDGSIVFNDTSRCVWGRIDAPPPAFVREDALEAYVLREYDHNRYSYDETCTDVTLPRKWDEQNWRQQ